MPTPDQAPQVRSSWRLRWSRVLALLLLGLGGSFLASGAEIVYDNTRTYLGSYLAATNFYGPTEFGDEIALAGNARVVTQFLFEYYGDFTPHGDETARIRFYANDGPGRYLKPQTVLYDSGPFVIQTNFAQAALIVPYVTVPSTFTWSVEFSGLTQQPGSQAGLLLYNPPTTGGQLASGRIGSYYDYWQKNFDTWSLFHYDGFDPPANFAARVIAEGLKMSAAREASTGACRLTWTGKLKAIYRVESSEDLLAWTFLGIARTGPDGDVQFTDAAASHMPRRFYRAMRQASLEEAPKARPLPDFKNGRFRVQWRGNPLVLYQIQASSNLVAWADLTAARADESGLLEYLDLDIANHPTRFYRALRSTAPSERPMLAAAAEPGHAGFRIRWLGIPGVIYPVERTTDFYEWTFVGAARAGADGRTELIDLTASRDKLRFYRLVLP